MTKEITKANILQQIANKFGMREYDKAKFLFDETVVPVYELSPEFRKQMIYKCSANIIATGLKYFRTTPQNERWTIWRYDLIFIGAATATVAGVVIERVLGSPDTIYLDLTAAQNTSYHKELASSAILDPGDKIGVNVDGFTSNQTLWLYLDYEVEELR